MPTEQALREAVEKAVADISGKVAFNLISTRPEAVSIILSALQPLLAPAASEREKELEAALGRIQAKVTPIDPTQRQSDWDRGAILEICENALDPIAKSATPPVSNDTRRLDWLITKSAMAHEGEPVVLIVTEEAVRECCGTWKPKYQAEVRQAIDNAMKEKA